MRPNEHYWITYHLALEAGFYPPEAEKIADANKNIDKYYPATALSGLGSLFGNETNYSRHFNALKTRLFGKDSRDQWAEHSFNLALKRGDASLLGQGLHSVQDKCVHQGILAQIDLSIFGKKIIATKWRDDPQKNRKGFNQAKKITGDYLKRFLQAKNL